MNPPKDEHVRRATAHQRGGAGVHKSKRRDEERSKQDMDDQPEEWDYYI